MIITGDCQDMLPLLDAESFDSCVTDPPYGLSFMNKQWDHDVPSADVWREVYRVLKPGAYLLAFFGTRTYHRGVCAIEDAGFEIRDQIQWMYGSGFPKSLDVSKAIDKHLGAERGVIGSKDVGPDMRGGNYENAEGRMVADATVAGSPEAKRWEGWGTALKPAHEPIVVARKPLIRTVAENVLKYSTGGLNIDGCRVGDEVLPAQRAGQAQIGTFERHDMVTPEREGRWPANVIHDGSAEVLEAFPDAKGQQGADGARHGPRTSVNTYGDYGPRPETPPRLEIEKSAARYFYCAKTSKSDRNDGLEHFVEQPSAASEFRPNHTEKAEQGEDGNPYGRWTPLKNNHPTVKPTDLMRHLCRLVTPPGGNVLDPYAGSGSTGRAAVLEGFEFTGIEMDERFCRIAEARIAAAEKQMFAELYE